MGRFLNPGTMRFQFALNSEIYVDKSGLIGLLNRRLNTEQRFVCVSRPRRFGKTMAGNMLCSYYGRGADARGQFENLAIARDATFEQHLNRYDVIRLNIRDFVTEAKSVEEMLARIDRVLCKEVAREHPDVDFLEEGILTSMLEDVYVETQTQFVFVIDEWDSVFRVAERNARDQTAYLDWLRHLMKDHDYIALAYMTGILPIKKYGEHSALNMFDEVSVTDAWPFAEYTGFTDGEVMELCERYGRDIGELRRWYDGYTVSGEAIYNPRSVVKSVTSGRLRNYWTQTESFNALRVYIDMDMHGLHDKVVRLVAGESLPLDTTTFENDMDTFATADDVLTLLVHLGYLTYDEETHTCRVPNLEVLQQYGSILRDDGWSEVARSIRESDRLLEATLAGDAHAVAELVAASHEECCSILRYNDENSLACAISLAYYAARHSYAVIRELPAGKGFADLAFVPRHGMPGPALVVELKADGTDGDGAVAQIRERRYAQGVKGLAGEVLLVGITYDPATKEHRCTIEQGVVE